MFVALNGCTSEAAHLAFNLALPTETVGTKLLALPDREITWIRRLYEKAVAGFYDVVLSGSGWRIDAGKAIGWLIEHKTSGIDKILPSMRTDVVLDHHGAGRRIVIDTKFTSIVRGGGTGKNPYAASMFIRYMPT